jgi:predicted DNA-binding ribbon-helix-helix protein
MSPPGKPSLLKRSVEVGGRKTSVSLEDGFWIALGEIAALRKCRRAELIAQINANHQRSNLSSAIRLFVLDFYRARAHECWTLHTSPSPSIVPTSSS